MLPSDERRIAQEEANERRENWLRWELPLLSEAPEGMRPLGPVLPSLSEQRRMHQELRESIWDSRRKRGDWSE
jgi:hypothetical protein